MGKRMDEALFHLRDPDKRDPKGKWCDVEGCEEWCGGKAYRPDTWSLDEIYYCKGHRSARKKRDKLLEKGVLPYMLDEL